MDTPGIGNKNTKDDLKLRKIARRTAADSDLYIFIFDGSKKIPGQILTYCNYIENKICIINKMDIIKKSRALPLASELSAYFSDIFFISGLKSDGINEIIDYILSKTYIHPWLFNAFDYNDLKNGEFLKELAREVVFNLFEHEIPYQIYVTNDKIEYKNNELYISQNIHIKENQRHIFVSKIKELSYGIRINISNTLKIKVHNTVQIKFQK